VWASRGPDQHHSNTDLAWSYKTPLPENVKIAGLVYNERADFIVEGERQVRPMTKFS
jgi:uncharacterized protein (DUF427 family)